MRDAASHAKRTRTRREGSKRAGDFGGVTVTAPASGEGPSRARSRVWCWQLSRQMYPDLAAATATNPPATRGPMMVLEGVRVWL